MAEEDTTAKGKVTIDTSDAVKSLDQLDGALKDSGRAAQAAGAASAGASRGFFKVSEAAKVSGRNLGLQVNQVSELALGFGALNPKVQQVALSFATAGNSAVTMGASMGPLGVAAGVLLTVVPPLVAALGLFGDEAEEAAGQVDQLGESLQDAARDLQNFIAAQERQRRIDAGQGSRFENQARLTELINERTDVERAARRDRESGFAREAQMHDARIRQLNEQIETLQLVESFTTTGLAAASVDPTRPARRGGRGRGGRGGGGADTRQDDIRALALGASEGRNDAFPGGPGQSEVELENTEKLRDIAEDIRQTEIGRAALAREFAEQSERATASFEFQLQLLQEQNEARQQAIRDASDIAEGALELFNASEGQMELFRGFSQAAQAVGSYPDVVGIAQHGTAAVLHFQNAAKAGVGGGGGKPATPVRPPQNQASGGQTIQINFNAPQSDALMGRDFNRSQRIARRRFG